MRSFAMLGKWHVHTPQYAREINEMEGCRVAKVWDPDDAVAEGWARELGCEAAPLDDILADPSIEGVVIGNATNEHDELIVRACESGKAVFTEKVLSLTNEGAERIAKAVRENGTRFSISLVHFSDPAVQFCVHTARSGALGKLNYARFRKAHNGATGDWLPAHFYDPVACGGGAMIDLGAHAMYLVPAVLGEPVNVKSTFTHVTGRAVEDNAVSVLEFADGAIGVSETGFVSSGYPLVFEIGGTNGTVIMQGSDVWISVSGDKTMKKIEQLPERKPSPLKQWALADSPDDIDEDLGLEAALRLTRVMVMAYSE
ncbi:MAG: Gfo/Idh/MocA family oxidoreductase [Clostridiales bacterium]|nr:Gfo/Idh/MocA family oxidoreductase [Clostridiales bacterium]